MKNIRSIVMKFKCLATHKWWHAPCHGFYKEYSRDGEHSFKDKNIFNKMEGESLTIKNGIKNSVLNSLNIKE